MHVTLFCPSAVASENVFYRKLRLLWHLLKPIAIRLCKINVDLHIMVSY